MSVEVMHDLERRRFTAQVEGTLSSLIYAPAESDTVDFLSTWVDPAVRGRGVGERLVLAGLEWARAEGLAVIPTCWYVGTVVARHPEYRSILRT